MVMGFCIGGPFIWSLLKRAPNHIATACWRSPWAGVRRCAALTKYPGRFWTSWGPAPTAKRPEITMHTADQFVTKMFETDVLQRLWVRADNVKES